MKRYGIPIFHSSLDKITPFMEEISYGIEEEGIFYYKEVIDDSLNPIEVAFKQAAKNNSGICVAINSRLTVIHLRKLEMDSPFGCYDTVNLTLEDFRSIGVNAARLLNCKPFVGVPGTAQDLFNL